MPKRESSRRKAKDTAKSRTATLVHNIEEDDIPDINLSDSDDDSTWKPSFDKGAGGSKGRLGKNNARGKSNSLERH